MFESDDYDEILSGLFYPEHNTGQVDNITVEEIIADRTASSTNENTLKLIQSVPSTKHTPFIHNFDFTKNHSTNTPRKRKFPGPAGLLFSGNKHKSPDNNQNIPQTQDFCLTQTGSLDTVLINLMKKDLENSLRNSTVNLSIYPIVSLTKGDVRSKLRGHKVPLIGGTIKSIDYSVPDPILVLKDESAEIQCLLHRDAWELFSKILLPLNSVILLSRPTIFTIGHALKKNYINITVNNIITIYCKKNDFCLSVDNNEWIKQMNGNIKKKYPNLLLSASASDENSEIFIFKVNQFDVDLIQSRSGDNDDPSDDSLNEQSIVQSVLEGIDTNFLFDDFTN